MTCGLACGPGNKDRSITVKTVQTETRDTSRDYIWKCNRKDTKYVREIQKIYMKFKLEHVVGLHETTLKHRSWEYNIKIKVHDVHVKKTPNAEHAA